MTNSLAQGVTCPECGAGPGESCRRAKGKTGSHKARIKAVRKLGSTAAGGDADGFGFWDRVSRIRSEITPGDASKNDREIYHHHAVDCATAEMLDEIHAMLRAQTKKKRSAR